MSPTAPRGGGSRRQGGTGGRPAQGRGRPAAGGKGGGKPFGKRAGDQPGKRSAGRGSARRMTDDITPAPAPPRRGPAPPRRGGDVHDPEGVRLQKFLAQAGAGSRRTCEDMITAGRVTVDDQVVTELGVRIDPSRQVVHVDGLRFSVDDQMVYIVVNKPKGVVSTMFDEQDRLNLADMVGPREERLFHVGRLDLDTEGLILLTNDGALAHRLQHPSFGVQKTYLAEVRGPVKRDLGKNLRAGVELDDGPVTVDSFRLVDSKPGYALVEVVLHEGRKHVVRRLLDAEGYPVLKLVRTQMGPLVLGDLKPGKNRRLTRGEVQQLMAAVGL
ncbi:rRNA pseudouridine synthase [Paenibacillus sp. TRM 82003]|uniref:pseudouridine synthase n=1 Tax=Kineococcus sp. TRM81007 TaxID=2925831 RepID=UPI001F576D05|nr:pseudouridine synthase [Kineococcus sp. TRM81007]MCI2240712.1 rRNA pseudouridine synthase [Kineococcus sp. TRM81007]MCI3925365.1 rRNA pseudouridine synthase [Paenibacillus sp. TRM 82003]